MIRLAQVALALSVLLTSAAADPGQTHLIYTATVKPGGPRHLHLSIEVRNPRHETLTFIVPHWAPGAYRELTVGARSRTVAWKQLSGFKAVDDKGKQRKVRADGDRRWQVDAKGATTITFTYTNTEPGRPSNNRSYLGSGSGLIDGPRNWVYVEGMKDLPVHVHFDLPDGWEVGSGLDPTFDPMVFSAKDYDRLIDCPTLVGKMRSWSFLYRGVPHRIVVDDGQRVARFDVEPFLDMVKRVVKVYVDMFDDVPYDHYTFIFTPGGGGLEHLTSTTIGGVRRLTPRGLMGVTAHEFFHAWNVKRLRPLRLGPFDYTGPQPVDDLWICEGLTSYYTPLGLWRAGLYQDEEFLQSQAGGIRSWESNPAHLVQSPQQSSRGVWTNDTRISYYLQGQVLGMMIDLAIRDESDNKYSLDDVMRHMYRKHGGYYRHHPPRPGFKSEDWPREIKALTGVDLEDFWDAHIRESQPVDWNRYLAAAGWKLELETKKASALAAAQTRRVEGGDTVLEVQRGGALFRAGFRDGDRVKAFNGAEVRGRFGLRRSLRAVDAGASFVADVVRSGKSVKVKGKAEAANEFGLLDYTDVPGGVRVGKVPRGTALYGGGLRDEDIVTAVDGKSVGTRGELRARLAGRSVGETATFSVKRGNDAATCAVKVQPAESRKVGRMQVLKGVTSKQERVRRGMKAGTTDR
ncbi:MAG: PDZ domain-containing protein [Planctomycetota bacterium]|nr:PDZ domain-containing protein [Planctomycetota bacterium]